VQLEPGDNLALHHAVYRARPGDVLVASTRGHFEAGYWGEILSTAASQRRLGGLVIDGCVRDGAALVNQNFPVFARGLCIRGTTKTAPNNRGPARIAIGDVVIEPGDLVVGDMDGVVVISTQSLDAVIRRAEQREQEERTILQRVAAGVPTLEALGNLRDIRASDDRGAGGVIGAMGAIGAMGGGVGEASGAGRGFDLGERSTEVF
jgi:4-hydroxy-4-methyl-2-oxoglutarate aldolase